MTTLIEPHAPNFEACLCAHLAVVRLHGADAASFLHGQVSNDIEGLGIDEWTMAAYCNPKGRVISILQVVRIGLDEFLLILPADVLDPVVKRLRMYVLRAKAKLEPEARTVIGIASAATARDTFDTVPEKGKVLAVPDGLLLGVGITDHRYLLIMDQGKLPERLEPDQRPDLWLSALAVDGIPEVFAGSSEEFLPQGLNMDLLDAVNFRKGCYPGQEIVARLRYLGKLKQRMVRVRFEGEGRMPGTSLHMNDSRTGHLVLCGPALEEGAWIGLASVNYAKLEGADCTFDDGTPLAIHHPPYSVPEMQPEGSSQPPLRGSTT